MNIALPCSFVVNKENLNFQCPETGVWKCQSLPELSATGLSEFSTCNICEDICCTVSNCLFDNEYSACINYQSPVVLLIFGLKGRANFKLAGRDSTCTVREGDVWLINVNQDEIVRNTSAGVHTKMLVVKYSTARINSAFKDSDHLKQVLGRSQILRLGYMVSVEQWVANLVNNPMGSAADRLLAEARALELIARWITPHNITQTPINTSVKTHNTEQLDKIIDLLVNDLSNPPSLQRLAKQVGMSHTCLNRNFKKVFGTTVFDWLRNYRLDRAEGYLKDNERSVTQIAFQCGFSSTSHFSKLFKSRYGCSPTEYRQG